MEVTDIQGRADLNEIRQIIAHRLGIDVQTVGDVIDEFFTVNAECVAIHDSTLLHGVGVFKLVPRAARKGVTPDGQPWERPAGFELIFEPSDDYKRRVEQYAGSGEPIY